MIRQGLNGFLMALADSVPGVSGGTVAFIMGFYDNFIGAIDDLMRGNRVQKKGSRKVFGKARNRLGNRHGAGGADIVVSF